MSNVFKTKASTLFAYVQYLGGLAVLLILIYKVVPEKNEDLIKMLATALIVSALKDAGQWMYKEQQKNFNPYNPPDNNCPECGKAKTNL
jgi:uncharacterized BrkB/YihY/UPF0761 family membrane protein